MLTLQYAKDPVWNNEENTSVYLIVKWEEFVEEMPFTAVSWDTEEWGRDVYARAVAGEFGEIAPYIKPIPPIIDFEPTPTGTQTL